jgi:glycerol kinase
LADLLGLPILHSSITDATALGCAFLTGLQVGFWKELREIQDLIQTEEIFYPQMNSSERQALSNCWHDLLKAGGILT